MSWKKFLIGEKMPDANDPAYKAKAERDRAAGAWFAQKTGMVKLAIIVQRYANRHPKRFLGISFGIVILGFIFTIANMVVAYNSGHKTGRKSSAVEQVDSALKATHHGIVMPRR